jgi:hypothetical protein
MKKTSNVTWQERGDFLADILDSANTVGREPMLAHAVNLFSPPGQAGKAPPPSGTSPWNKQLSATHRLPCAQLRMIQSMRIAADFAVKSCGKKPDFIGIADCEDLPLVPANFESLCLEETATDLPDLLHMPTESQPPRLFAILAAMQKSRSEATHVVFTNSDIHLQPWFYVTAGRFLQAGFDSLIINRRTVHQETTASSCMPVELLMAESGITHPGLDCFVFPRQWLVRMMPTHAVVGRGAVMRSLLFNVVAIAEKLLVLSHAQLTYHFGDDRPWMQETSQAAHKFNKLQAAGLWLRLVENDVSRHRLVELGKLFPKYLPELHPEVLEKFLD